MNHMLGTYPVHEILLNKFDRRRERSIANKQALMLFLLVCCTGEKLEEDKSKSDENCQYIVNRIEVGAAGERGSDHCCLNGERTGDARTSRGYEIIRATCAELWTERIHCKEQVVCWVLVLAITGIVLWLHFWSSYVKGRWHDAAAKRYCVQREAIEEASNGAEMASGRLVEVIDMMSRRLFEI